MKPDTLTVTAAAAKIGVAPATVGKWIAAGKLPGRKEGRCVLIPVAALEALTRRTCRHCGNPFSSARPTRAGFCSRSCRWADTYARRKATHPATRGPGRPPKVTAPRPLDLGNERLRAALEATRPG